jgi:hypothetical protein
VLVYLTSDQPRRGDAPAVTSMLAGACIDLGTKTLSDRPV